MEQKLLLKCKAITLFAAAVLILAGCENVFNSKNPHSKPDFNDPEELLNFAKQEVGDSVEAVVYDFFDVDSVRKVAVGIEVLNDEEWGIRFAFYKEYKDTLLLVYKTELLDGSMNESEFKAVKIDKDYNYLYYNSKSYFLGSGGGEIMAYLVDLPDRQVYYSHLFMIPNKPVSLYLSKNIKQDSIKDYFIALFKNDYPELKIVSTDVKLSL
ncbi:MAG TPA: hypothetical protein PK397_08785 [Ignavibacteriaceae bacterium]|nr:hypothetical protein [Ignavibacteriaceae bacterium]